MSVLDPQQKRSGELHPGHSRTTSQQATKTKYNPFPRSPYRNPKFFRSDLLTHGTADHHMVSYANSRAANKTMYAAKKGSLNSPTPELCTSINVKTPNAAIIAERPISIILKPARARLPALFGSLLLQEGRENALEKQDGLPCTT